MLNFQALVKVDMILKVNLYLRFAHFYVIHVPIVQGCLSEKANNSRYITGRSLP